MSLCPFDPCFYEGNYTYLFALQIDQRVSTDCRKQVLFMGRQRNHSPPRTPSWIKESEILGTVWTGLGKAVTIQLPNTLNTLRKVHIVNNCIFKREQFVLTVCIWASLIWLHPENSARWLLWYSLYAEKLQPRAKWELESTRESVTEPRIDHSCHLAMENNLPRHLKGY